MDKSCKLKAFSSSKCTEVSTAVTTRQILVGGLVGPRAGLDDAE
jgi:hypothetical protein